MGAMVIPPVFTPAEVAERLNCNKRTVLRLLAKGTLPGFRIGSDWRIRADVLEAYTRGIIGEPKPAPAKATKAKPARKAKARRR